MNTTTNTVLTRSTISTIQAKISRPVIPEVLGLPAVRLT
jgi:hypothetical protein